MKTRHYEKDNLPLDHPNGMCVVTGEISKSLKEIGEELGDWAAGRTQNPELDRWLNPSAGKERGKYSANINLLITTILRGRLSFVLTSLKLGYINDIMYYSIFSFFHIKKKKMHFIINGLNFDKIWYYS